MRKIVIVVILSFLTLQMFAQETSLKEKIYLGGSFGLSFGTYTYVEIAPEGFYQLTDRLHVGTGVGYTYFADHVNKVNSYNIGGKVAARFIIVDFLYAQVEYEGIRYKDNYFRSQTNTFFDETRLLVGGGYRQWIGENSFSYVNLFINPDAYGSTYFSGINPVLKIGFSFGF